MNDVFRSSCLSPVSRKPLLTSSRFAAIGMSAITLLALSLGLTGCGAAHTASEASGGEITGLFKGGQQPVTGTQVQLYAVGTAGDSSAATPLLTPNTVYTSDGTGVTGTTGNSSNGNNSFPAGAFNIPTTFSCPTPTTEIYIVGTGGNPGLGAGGSNPNLAMMADIGQCQNLGSTYVQINELTTVASIAPVAPFMSGYATLGSGTNDATQLANAMDEVNEYANLRSGTVPGPALPSGYDASSTALTTLADIMAYCINTSGGVAGDKSPCGYLFQYATPPGGAAPTDTVGAIINIQQNPTLNVAPIFGLLPATPQYSPVLPASNPPTTWALPITDSTEAKLVFGVQPANTVAGATMSPAVTVTIEDASGNVQTGATNAITMSLGANPSNATLGGLTTVNAIDGVATFNNLSLKLTGTGYTLAASAAGLTGATSTSFNITPGTPSKLAFSTIATTVPSTSAIAPAPTVSIEDANGNVVTTSSASVSVAIGTNPASGSLSGTTTTTASSGVATFSNLSINNIGSGYTLTATSGALTGTSNPFNVTGGAINVNGVNVANNSIAQLSPSLPTSATANTVITLTSTDPTHFLLSTSSTAVGTSSVNVTVLTGNYTSSTPVFVQGQNYSGSTAITAPVTATATGFANGSGIQSLYPSGFGFYPGSVINTTTQASSTQLTVGFFGETPGSLVPNFQAQLGPQAAPVTYTVTSGTTATGTITGSPATFPVASVYGQTTYFQPVAAGTSTITLTEPTGYTTPSTNNWPMSFTATVTAPTISVTNGSVANNAITGFGVSLQTTPTATDTFTISISDSTHFLLTTNNNAVGTGSIMVTVGAGGNLPTIYLEGQNYSGTTAINATLTVTDSLGIYAAGTATMSLVPSGFGFFPNSVINSTTTSSPTQLTVGFLGLTPGTLVPATQAQLGPQAAVVTYTVTSGTTTVGTITGSPATFPVASVYGTTTYFNVAGGGTSTITLTEPAGYSTPSSSWPMSFTATVTAPTISVGSATVANNSFASFGVSLQTSPSATDTFTISVNDASHFLLTTNPYAVGASSIQVQVGPGGSIPTIYLEGQNYSGTTAIMAMVTVTDSLNVYGPGSGTMALYPSGFGFYPSGNLSTTTQSTPTSLTVGFLGLNPGSLTVAFQANLGPQAAAVTYTVASSATTVGTISGSPAAFPVASVYGTTTAFNPAHVGTSTITLTEPSGYSTPSSGWPMSFSFTVTAPSISVDSVTVGNNLITGFSVGLQTTPMQADTFTITSNDPTHFLLSTSPYAVGSASLTIPVSAGGSLPYLYLEGQNFNNNSAAWTTTVTVTDASGTYSMGTGNMSLYPSGLGFYPNSSFSTTGSSSPTGLTIGLNILVPGTLAFAGQGSLGPQAASPAFTISSSTPSVGTVPGTGTFTVDGSTYCQTLSFQPASGVTGTTTLTINQPPGYNASTSSWTPTISVSVSP